VTDAATPGEERAAPPAPGEIDLDAIESDLDDVEQALHELADGTYWDRAGRDDAHELADGTYSDRTGRDDAHELADGTYWDRAGRDDAHVDTGGDPARPADPTTADAPR
jgi:hypothetical protein